MKKSRSQPAFVMLMTLMLLALAAVVMLSLTRRSVDRAAAAADAERAMSEKWTHASIRWSVLPRADEILRQAESASGSYIPELPLTLTLSGRSFELVVADEQAKANLNAIHELDGISAASRAANSGVASRYAFVVDLAVDPRYDPEADAADTTTPIYSAFGSWAQVFRSPEPSDLLPVDQDGHRPIEGLTCWGDGRLNIMRASAESVRNHAGDLLAPGDIRRLLKIRQELMKAVEAEPAEAPESQEDASPDESVAEEAVASSPLDELLNQLELEPDARAALDVLWTDASYCVSLSIVCVDKRRVHYELAVLTSSDPTIDSAETDATSTTTEGIESDTETDEAQEQPAKLPVPLVSARPVLQRWTW